MKWDSMITRPGLLLAGTFSLLACGGGSGAAKPSQVSTTSANVSASSTTDTADDHVRDLETQRDDARRRAEDAEKRADAVEEARLRDKYALRTLLERDVLLHDVWSELDRIDHAIQVLKTEMPQARPARRTQIEKTVKDAVTKRNEVDKAIRQVHTISNAEWRQFAYGIASEVEEIESKLDSLESL